MLSAYRALQRALFVMAFYATRLMVRRRRPVSWVIGPQETASMVHHIGRLIPDSRTVSLWPHPFYDFGYDAEFTRSGGDATTRIIRGLFGALTLGRLGGQARGVMFLGQQSFLVGRRDAREFEFTFLKRHGVAVVCYFVGTDIRSPALMAKLRDETGYENLGTRLVVDEPSMGTPAYEDAKRRLADVADRLADEIFSASMDQLSYLRRRTRPITYFFPDESFGGDVSRFNSPERLIVVHAPSKPVLKGTALVREVVQQLRAEGFDFEYRELIGVPNSVVREQLREAHIVLNQFYAFIPGVFGIEALASGCAVLMSADEHLEPDLPAGSNDAWLVTRYDQITDHLRFLLTHPEQIGPLGQRGKEWAVENVSFSHAGGRLRKILDDLVS